MALVKEPAGSYQAVGSVGRTTFAIQKGACTARRRSYPSNPGSSRQTAVRSTLASAAAAWALLTTGNRANWEVYAAANPEMDRLGNLRTLSGFNMFVRAYCVCDDIGFGNPDDPPAFGPPVPVVAPVATGGAGQVSIAFTAHGGLDTTIELWGVGPHSVGRTPLLAAAKRLSYGPAQTTPLVKTGLAAGFWTFWVRNIDEVSGQTSTLTRLTATVT